MPVLTNRNDFSAEQTTSSSLNFKLNTDNTLALTNPPWIVEAERRLTKLMNLGEDWDGEGSSAPTARLAGEVIRYLLDGTQHDTPAPHISAVGCGGLQVEWHNSGYDLEIHFFDDDQRTYFYVSPDGKEKEGNAVADSVLIRAVISALSGHCERILSER